MKSLLDPNFRYVPSATTDIRQTFARVRNEAAGLAHDAPARSPHPHARPHIALVVTAPRSGKGVLPASGAGR